jgi:hypothetical protein
MFAKKVTQQIDKNPSALIFPAVESASFTPDVGSRKLLQMRHSLLSVGHSARFSQGEALIRKKHQYLTCKLNFDVVGALALPEMPRITSKTAISKPKPGCSPYRACATSYQINSISTVNSMKPWATLKNPAQAVAALSALHGVLGGLFRRAVARCYATR